MRSPGTIALVAAWVAGACGADSPPPSGGSTDDTGSSTTAATSSGADVSSSGDAGLQVEVHGHRGDRGTVPPGNTIPSFESALAHGVDALEGDLQITLDAEVVFGHDNDLETTGCTWAGPGTPPPSQISMMSAQDVASWDCHAELDGIQPPPPLAEVLALDEAVAFNLEFKTWGDAAADTYTTALIASDQGCGGCLGPRLTIQSFDWDALAYARETYGDQLSFRVSLLALAARPELEAARAYADVWSPTKDIATPELVADAQSLGYAVVPWTVNETSEMQSLIDAGVDGMITDYPAALLELLGR